MYVKAKNNLEAWRRQGQTRRRLRRWSVSMEATIWIDDTACACTVIDLSPAGARVQLKDVREVPIGSELELELEDFGAVPCEVRYSEAGALGLMFLHEDEGEVELARYLVARRPERQSPRRRVELEATLTPRKAQSACVIEDASRSGASVLVSDADSFREDDEVILSIDGYGDVAATVRRVSEGRIGLMFDHPLTGVLPF